MMDNSDNDGPDRSNRVLSGTIIVIKNIRHNLSYKWLK